MRQLVQGAAALLLAAVVVMWGWNTVAAALLGAPAMQYRHALATLLALAAVEMVGAGALRFFAPRGRGA